MITNEKYAELKTASIDSTNDVRGEFEKVATSEALRAWAKKTRSLRENGAGFNGNVKKQKAWEKKQDARAQAAGRRARTEALIDPALAGLSTKQRANFLDRVTKRGTDAWNAKNRGVNKEIDTARRADLLNARDATDPDWVARNQHKSQPQPQPQPQPSAGNGQNAQPQPAPNTGGNPGNYGSPAANSQIEQWRDELNNRSLGTQVGDAIGDMFGTNASKSRARKRELINRYDQETAQGRSIVDEAATTNAINSANNAYAAKQGVTQDQINAAMLSRQGQGGLMNWASNHKIMAAGGVYAAYNMAKGLLHGDENEEERRRRRELY